MPWFLHSSKVLSLVDGCSPVSVVPVYSAIMSFNLGSHSCSLQLIAFVFVFSYYNCLTFRNCGFRCWWCRSRSCYSCGYWGCWFRSGAEIIARLQRPSICWRWRDLPVRCVAGSRSAVAWSVISIGSHNLLHATGDNVHEKLIRQPSHEVLLVRGSVGKRFCW